MEMGFRAIIAPSFADIFRNNCMQNGLLPVILDSSEVDTVMARALRGSGYSATVDLESQTVTDDQGLDASFEVDPFRKNSLLKGLDDVGITLYYEDSIESFESNRAARW
jgi:3-isopropylmalate/(R)-2-methylmalate dehydratase small subunit